MAEQPQLKRRIVKRVALSIIALVLVAGAATFLWQRTLLNRAARIEIGNSRKAVLQLQGSPVATASAAIRGDNGAVSEYVTELYDPTFGTKLRINDMFEPLGWSPFRLDLAGIPVRLHFDDDGCVGLIKRGEVVLSK